MPGGPRASPVGLTNRIAAGRQLAEGASGPHRITLNSSSLRTL
ncbi:hypothetical protein [Streptomyces sp. MBT98]|nr:hypothetical protein [Streptomyces sp. MBT98]